MKASLTRLVGRVQGWGPVRLLMEYGQSNAGNYAAGLAFKAFLSMFPLILGILAIVGVLLGNFGVQHRVQALIVGSFPGSAQTQITQSLHAFHQHAGLLGLVSILGLMWASMGLFGFMEFTFDQIYEVKTRSFLPQKAMGLGMMAVFIVGILIAVGASSAIAFVPAVPYLGFVVGWAAMVALLMVIYRVVPNTPLTLGQAWPGALLAGLLIEGLTLAFPLYSEHMVKSNTYFQAFTLFFMLAAWLYLMSQFLLLGVVLNRMLAGGRPRRLRVVGTDEQHSA